MDRISGLPDELLVKILSLLPPKAVVSTSILSKRWESLWLWVPKLDFEMNHYKSDPPLRDSITKNLSLLKPPVLESFRLQCFSPTFQPKDIKHWVETCVSRCVRDLNINYFNLNYKSKPVVLIPSSLYTCKSLVTLKLNGRNISLDVPRNVYLPSLKTLELGFVIYANEDSLQLLLMYCPVLEDLVIHRDGDDNMKTINVQVRSLLRLTLPIDGGFDSDGYVIVTPSLKYFEVTGLYTEAFSYLITQMPMVEEANLSVVQDVERLFEAITSVKRLTLSVLHDIRDESIYHNGIVFNQLEHLTLHIGQDDWAKLLVRLLEDSPKLRVLNLLIESDEWFEEENEHVSWKWNNDDQSSSVPKCLLESLETFEFVGYTGRQEERDVVSYILKNARHLKSSSIKHLSLLC